MTDQAEDDTGFQKLLGYRLAGWREGEAQLELEIRPHLSNRTGTPHGGVHATLLDTAMGYSLCWVPEGAPRRFVVTSSLTVNYLGLPKGEKLIATGQMTGGGRKTVFASGRLSDELGTLIATATGVFRRLD